MAVADQVSWSRVKERLRADVGDDVYSSWFARMDLEGLEDKTVRLSVPTRFLKSWIQSHYAERVLACWQAHDNNVARIELTVRSAVLRSNVAVTPRETAPVVNGHMDAGRMNGHARPLMPADAAGHEALGGSPLDPRLTFDSFVIGRSNTLALATCLAAACASAKRTD